MKKVFVEFCAFLGAVFIYIYGLTLRVRYLNDSFVKSLQEKDQKGGVLYAHWHQDLLAAIALFCGKGRKVCTMASMSSDGEIIAKVLKYLKVQVVRGSQGKRGFEALYEMAPFIQKDCDGALAVDGSRGPQYKVKKGIIYLAKNTGLPIVPGSGDFKRKFVFRSWDSMFIPYPFSRGVAVYGDPIYVPQDASEELVEKKREEVEQSLLKVKGEAQKYCKNTSRAI